MDSLEIAKNEFYKFYKIIKVKIKLYKYYHKDDLPGTPSYCYKSIVVNGFDDPQKYQETLFNLKDILIKSLDAWKESKSREDIFIKTEELKSELQNYELNFQIKPIPNGDDGFRLSIKNTTLRLTNFYDHIHKELEFPGFFKINEYNYDVIHADLSLFLKFQYDILNSLKDYLDTISYYYSDTVTKEPDKYFSFIPTNENFDKNNSNNIKASLVWNNLIEDVDYRDFRRLFNNERLMKPIIWTGDESVLYYFIKTLIERKYIENHKVHWIITSKCFVIKEKGITRPIIPARIARLKPPNRNIDYSKIDKVFNYF